MGLGDQHKGSYQKRHRRPLNYPIVVWKLLAHLGTYLWIKPIKCHMEGKINTEKIPHAGMQMKLSQIKIMIKTAFKLLES